MIYSALKRLPKESQLKLIELIILGTISNDSINVIGCEIYERESKVFKKIDGYQGGLASMVYMFFDKKSQGRGLANNNENIQLANELHKPIIRKFKERKKDVFIIYRQYLGY